MILSASRRTDIPCCYSDWLLNRLREGCVMVRNPLNPRQVSRISLSPDVVDAIVFWSKDPTPLLPKLDAVDAMGYRYLFQFTITPYDRAMEPGLRDREERMRTFSALSRRLGPDSLVWRYDPILVSEDYSVDYHRKQFTALCEKLAGYTDEVVISFVDCYRKLGKRVRPVQPEDIASLAAFIGETAARFGFSVRACCENMDLTPYGIAPSACIDRKRLERVCGAPLSTGPDKNQRTGCGCCESVDIGAYDTCPNGCLYCYANRSTASIQRNLSLHDPASPLLVGNLRPDDRVTDRIVRSYIVDQTSLFPDR